MKRRSLMLTTSLGAAVGVAGLIGLSLPASAGQAPALPTLSPQSLVQSVITAQPQALSGTVQVDNELGLPALPGGGQSAALANGTKQFQVWSDGRGDERVAVPSQTGEQTLVKDGKTLWNWNSAKRTATETHLDAKQNRHGVKAAHGLATNPTAVAQRVVATLQKTSTVTVDGTGNVAGRPAYELVLTPKPTERTLLRQVRIAVDAQRRIPLSVEVDTNGSSAPALQVGFTKLDFTAPAKSLFQFTPPAGAKVVQHSQKPAQHPARPAHQIVGNGWDAVLLTKEPPQLSTNSKHQSLNANALLQRIGKPVSGTWGHGWVISSKAITVLVTSDGRVAAGAVPTQVLTDALGQTR